MRISRPFAVRILPFAYCTTSHGEARSRIRFKQRAAIRPVDAPVWPTRPPNGAFFSRINISMESLRPRHLRYALRGLYGLSLATLVSCRGALVRAMPSSVPARPARAFLDESGEKAQLLMIGTFHFANPGLDGYKPVVTVDVLSPAKQREVAEIVQDLARYRPTKIAVEARSGQQGRLDSLYREFVAGRFQPSSNEVYQIGFRLARMLGHPRVYAIDAASRSYFPGMTSQQYDAKVGELRQDSLRNTIWRGRFNALYRYEDSLKTVRTLREVLYWLNEPDNVTVSHGSYLVGPFRFGAGDDYFGPDDATEWYNRNLRIFSNLQRITDSPRERMLLVIGAGHLPILRFLALASPEYRLSEATEYLGAP